MTDETFRSQMFIVRAEDMTVGGDNYVEMKMPLEHILTIIDLLLKQRRSPKIGRNFLDLLLTSNPKAVNLLQKMGYTEFKRVNKDGDER
jgi:hypothetical protein